MKFAFLLLAKYTWEILKSPNTKIYQRKSLRSEFSRFSNLKIREFLKFILIRPFH